MSEPAQGHERCLPRIALRSGEGWESIRAQLAHDVRSRRREGGDHLLTPHRMSACGGMYSIGKEIREIGARRDQSRGQAHERTETRGIARIRQARACRRRDVREPEARGRLHDLPQEPSRVEDVHAESIESIGNGRVVRVGDLRCETRKRRGTELRRQPEIGQVGVDDAIRTRGFQTRDLVDHRRCSGRNHSRRSACQAGILGNLPEEGEEIVGTTLNQDQGLRIDRVAVLGEVGIDL